MGHVGSKTRSVGQMIEKPCEHNTGHIMHPIIMKFVRMFALMKSGLSSNMSLVGSKTRSVGQIIEKPCEHSRGHSVCPIFIKLAPNNHLDNISVKFEYGSCRVKNHVSGPNQKKNFVKTLQATLLSNLHQLCSA